MLKPKFTKKQINQFKKIGIETIYLFGSQAEGFATPNSDVDIGVVFSCPKKYKDKTMDAYLKIDKIFSDVFPKVKKIDVVFLQFTTIALQFNAIKYGKVLYEKSEEKRFDYHEKIIRIHADLEYLYKLEYKCVLERI